jgi:hypothetical protein
MVLSGGRDQPAVARTNNGDRRIRAIGRGGFSDPTRPRRDSHTPSLDPCSSRVGKTISAGAIVAQRPARPHSDSTRSTTSYRRDAPAAGDTSAQPALLLLRREDPAVLTCTHSGRPRPSRGRDPPTVRLTFPIGRSGGRQRVASPSARGASLHNAAWGGGSTRIRLSLRRSVGGVIGAGEKGPSAPVAIWATDRS